MKRSTAPGIANRNHNGVHPVPMTVRLLANRRTGAVLDLVTIEQGGCVSPLGPQHTLLLLAGRLRTANGVIESEPADTAKPPRLDCCRYLAEEPSVLLSYTWLASPFLEASDT